MKVVRADACRPMSDGLVRMAVSATTVIVSHPVTRHPHDSEVTAVRERLYPTSRQGGS